MAPTSGDSQHDEGTTDQTSGSTTRFVTSGALPPVARSHGTTPPVSASDQAFGDVAGDAIDALGRAIGVLPDDKDGALAQLDDKVGKQRADIDHKTKFTPPPPKLTAPPPTDRAALERRIRMAGTKEDGELDAALRKQLADLDRSLGAEQNKLDDELAAETAATATATRTHDKAAGSQIAAADRTNRDEVATETKRDTREATKQHAALDKTTSGERSWHEAAGEQSKAEWIKPAVDKHVGGTRALGAPLATSAAAIGDSKAREAGSNAGRAASAQMIGNVTAGSIGIQAELSAQKLSADGNKLVESETKRTAAAEDAISREAETQGKRIGTQATIAANEMKGLADDARTRMDAARANATSQEAAVAGGVHAAMEAERAAAQRRGDALRTETATKLRDTLTSAKATVQATVDKLLGELAATPDKDLAKEGAALGGELAKLDQTDGQASHAMTARASSAEQTVAKEDAGHARAMHARGVTARAGIDKVAQEARQQITTANKPTERDIAGAARRGREAIDNVGADANKDVVAFSAKRLTDDNKAGDKELADYNKQADAGDKQLGNMASGVGAAVDKAWVDDVMKGATTSLDGKLFFYPTGDEALSGLRAITSLPPKLQGDAIKLLTDQQFNNLLARVPEGNREELDALVKNTTDPQRKLELWGVYHKAHAAADAQRLNVGSDADAMRRGQARINAAKTTAVEVDEEMAALYLHVTKTGKPFTTAEVDELITRKDTEHAMEMKYNVNFTNAGGVRADGSHIHWKEDELEALNKTLSRMPAAQTAGNKDLTEIRRQENVFWNNDPKSPLGGLATGTQVLIPDNAASTASIGEPRQLADPALGPDVSTIEWLITHELGHNVSNHMWAVEQKFERANGWESYGKDTDALTAAEKATLEAKRLHGMRDRAQVNKGGKTYEIDQDTPGYISYTQGALASDGEGTPEAAGYVAGPTGTDPWGYSRTRGYEQFAEYYNHAMHTPEKLYADMITTPHQDTEAKRAQVAAATNDAARATAQKDLDIAEKAEAARKQSYELMRNDVFGTDKEQQLAEARLAARGVAPAKVHDFQKRAAVASTPDQIHVIEREFL
ncbi:MAG: hypothetical protein ABI591_05875 [Kofleriaceae bacterium]